MAQSVNCDESCTRCQLVVTDSLIIYEGLDSPYLAVCRAKLNLIRSSAADCRSSPLLEWAQCAQDKKNMEPAPDGSSLTHGWMEG